MTSPPSCRATSLTIVSIFVLIVVCSLSSSAVAQQGTVILKGVVYDGATSKALSDASVFVAAAGVVTTTNDTGAFELPVHWSTHVLTIRKPGYRARSFRLTVDASFGKETNIGVIPLEVGAEAATQLAGAITSDGTAVARANIVVNGKLIGLADDEGRFRVDRVEVGPNVLAIRRIGYRPAVLELEILDSAAPASVTVALDAVPLQLEEIVVDGDRTVYAGGRMRDFYRRRQTGLGKYFTRWEIERANPMFMSDLLRRVAGVRVTHGSFGRNRIAMTRSSCSPLLYIDGLRVPASEIDDLVWPDAVQGMEVYNGAAFAPVEYSGFGGNCGVILIWTR